MNNIIKIAGQFDSKYNYGSAKINLTFWEEFIERSIIL